MDELFSCRNCVHNACQSLNIGCGPGFCIKHDSVMWAPDTATCKYLHRKDLPRFVVDEGIREHAAEFAGFSGMVNLHSRQPIARLGYSERFAWERRTFDPLVNSLAQYRKINPSWCFIQAMSGGVDGRRLLTHAALIRRYMDRCGTWISSYRLVLALLQELPVEPRFADGDLRADASLAVDEVRTDALWDVVFTSLAGIQEYGFHAGLAHLMWATDELNGGLSSLDWPVLQGELLAKRPLWTDAVIVHATDEGYFFAKPPVDDAGDEEPPEA